MRAVSVPIVTVPRIPSLHTPVLQVTEDLSAPPNAGRPEDPAMAKDEDGGDDIAGIEEGSAPMLDEGEGDPEETADGEGTEAGRPLGAAEAEDEAEGPLAEPLALALRPKEVYTVGLTHLQNGKWMVSRTIATKPFYSTPTTFRDKIQAGIAHDLMLLTDSRIGLTPSEARSRGLNYDLGLHMDPRVGRLLHGTNASEVAFRNYNRLRNPHVSGGRRSAVNKALAGGGPAGSRLAGLAAAAEQMEGDSPAGTAGTVGRGASEKRARKPTAAAAAVAAAAAMGILASDTDSGSDEDEDEEEDSPAPAAPPRRWAAGSAAAPGPPSAAAAAAAAGVALRREEADVDPDEIQAIGVCYMGQTGKFQAFRAINGVSYRPTPCVYSTRGEAAAAHDLLMLQDPRLAFTAQEARDKGLNIDLGIHNNPTVAALIKGTIFRSRLVEGRLKKAARQGPAGNARRAKEEEDADDDNGSGAAGAAPFTLPDRADPSLAPAGVTVLGCGPQTSFGWWPVARRVKDAWGSPACGYLPTLEAAAAAHDRLMLTGSFGRGRHSVGLSPQEARDHGLNYDLGIHSDALVARLLRPTDPRTAFSKIELDGLWCLDPLEGHKTVAQPPTELMPEEPDFAPPEAPLARLLGVEALGVRPAAGGRWEAGFEHKGQVVRPEAAAGAAGWASQAEASLAYDWMLLTDPRLGFSAQEARDLGLNYDIGASNWDLEIARLIAGTSGKTALTRIPRSSLPDSDSGHGAGGRTPGGLGAAAGKRGRGRPRKDDGFLDDDEEGEGTDEEEEEQGHRGKRRRAQPAGRSGRRLQLAPLALLRAAAPPPPPRPVIVHTYVPRLPARMFPEEAATIQGMLDFLSRVARFVLHVETAVGDSFAAGLHGPLIRARAQVHREGYDARWQSPVAFVAAEVEGSLASAARQVAEEGMTWDLPAAVVVAREVATTVPIALESQGLGGAGTGAAAVT